MGNHCIHVFDTYVKPYLHASNDNENKEEDKDEQCVESLLILAHSAGGSRTAKLLYERGNIMKPCIKAIAFTDIGDPRMQVLNYTREVDKKDDCEERAKLITEIY